MPRNIFKFLFITPARESTIKYAKSKRLPGALCWFDSTDSELQRMIDTNRDSDEERDTCTTIVAVRMAESGSKVKSLSVYWGDGREPEHANHGLWLMTFVRYARNSMHPVRV